MMRTVLIISFLLLSYISQAQELNDFSLQDASSGNTFTLNDINAENGVAIIFSSNNCPFDKYYTARIKNLYQDYAEKGIAFILVNAHTGPDEDIESMKKQSLELPDIPYLADKEQVLAQQLGATRSPEVFLLKNDNDSYSIYYQGAIDNNPQVAADVKNHYLKDNLQNLVEGKPAAHSGTRPAGCRIK